MFSRWCMRWNMMSVATIVVALNAPLLRRVRLTRGRDKGVTAALPGPPVEGQRVARVMTGS
ncbi:hypothetical protein [Micromonospora zamorensis]|uniref:hypothetical protein n=1 Tax=Micromonospora zamorensis TaxID=709883 RepID=UPI003CEC247F